jgi:hypothetical protein
MKLCGTIGTKNVFATLENKSFVLSDTKKTLMESLWFIGLQRVSVGLKTCDVVWVNQDKYFVQSIDKNKLTELRGKSFVPIYDIGPDPAPWKRWHKNAVRENWAKKDWDAFLNNDQYSDSDYVPESEESGPSESEEEDSDEESEAEDYSDEEERPSKKRKKKN